MPMVDFYNTLPRAEESPMEYWIWLNKAIDVADECLRRRNKFVEDPAAEAVLMFLSHCPDPGLFTSSLRNSGVSLKFNTCWIVIKGARKELLLEHHTRCLCLLPIRTLLRSVMIPYTIL